MRISYWKATEDGDEEVVTIREAKKLLKEQGGRAWTVHYERGGQPFEVTPIELKGNNSSHRYNHHL